MSRTACGSGFGVTSELLEKARKAVLDTPSTVFLRSGDPLHLACAEEHGFQEVYTNDRHMLKGARHFHLTGVEVLGRERLRYSAQAKSVDGWWTDRRRHPDPHDYASPEIPRKSAHARGRSITADLPPRLIRNQQVRGSSPRAGSIHQINNLRGLVRPSA